MYYILKMTGHVVADWMTGHRFGYMCMCGKAHWHGNCGDPVTNRDEIRVSHCPVAGFESIVISITPETKRVKKKRRRRYK